MNLRLFCLNINTQICTFILLVVDSPVHAVLTFSQAAEQAKASPALVAKDPSTSTNKKEEEDLAKG